MTRRWDFPSETDIRIKDAIRSRVEELGLRQGDIADALEVSQPAVARILLNRSAYIPGSLVRLLDQVGLELVVAVKK